MNILESILAAKRSAVAHDRIAVPPAELKARLADAPPTRDFRRALRTPGLPAIIAEIKRRSPSAGPIRPDLDVPTIARAYQQGGATALSVLTDAPNFGGSLEAMRSARAAITMPVLRKEFIVDEYQIIESRVHGADAILLIAGALPAAQLADFHAGAQCLGMDVLVEIHDEHDLASVEASRTRPSILGINNRDLRAQRTDLSIFEHLAPRVIAAYGESLILVAESGIATNTDARRMQRAGATALLVGESLLRAPDPATALRNLRETEVLG